MKKLIFLFIAITALCFAQDAGNVVETPQITPHIVQTPNAVFPQVMALSIDSTTLTVCFNWLNAQGERVDSGNSIAHYQTTDPTNVPTDAELEAGIEAVAPKE